MPARSPLLASDPARSFLGAVALMALATAVWPAHATAGDSGSLEHGVDCGCLAHRLEWARELADAHGSRLAIGEAAAGAYDPATGADFRNFPPDPLVRYEHMRLDITVPALEDRAFTAVQTLRVSPIGVPVDTLTLNAEGLDIQEVTVGGKPVEWSHDGKRLAIRFAKALPEGTTEVVTRYACRQPVRGMTFSPATPELSGVAPARAAQLHTQGQPETNRYWFPIHDSPNVRLATELVVNVPAGVPVSGNGRLVEHREQGGRATWHWSQDKPHVPYLVSLVAGSLERVDLPNARSGVPMTVWAPPGRGSDARATYVRTDDMVAMFERRFGVKYPWARYDQLVVRNFGSGGMENTSATTMHPSAVYDSVALADGDMDGLIAHELCHQWTGDLITCRSWEHLWLNEGWATYGTALWMEERDGADGYYDSMLGNAGVAARDSTEGEIAMCSPVWGSPGETFSRAANPYPKGASILHMLRRMLGDEVFFEGVRAYMNRHAGGLVETDDFRRAMEEASGLGLEWFFDQWCFRPGCPRVKAEASYDASTRTLTVKATQTQKMDARTPALRIRMPVWVRTAGGDRVVPFEMRTRDGQVQVVLDGPPMAVWVDPWLDALKTLELSQPESWTLGALQDAPTTAARRQAMGTLGKTETAEARQALERLAADAKARHTMRVAAIETLSQYRSPESQAAVLRLFDAGCADARVQAALVAALATCAKADAQPRMAKLLAPAGQGGTASYAVRAAALDGLVAIDAAEELALVRTQVAYPSHAERVSLAALKALQKWGQAEDVPAVKARAALGVLDRARPEAVETLAAIAPRLQPDARREVEVFVLALLDDPETRTANAAGQALATMKCKEALPRLRAMAEKHADPAQRSRAERWVKSIEG